MSPVVEFFYISEDVSFPALGQPEPVFVHSHHEEVLAVYLTGISIAAAQVHYLYSFHCEEHGPFSSILFQ